MPPVVGLIALLFTAGLVALVLTVGLDRLVAWDGPARRHALGPALPCTAVRGAATAEQRLPGRGAA